MTARLHDLALLPRDGLFCKDGRGWFTFGSGRAHGLDWPLPATVLGALCTAWGRLWEADLKRPLTGTEWADLSNGLYLDAVVALRRPVGEPWRVGHRLWPVPADVLYLEDGAVERLIPRPVQGATLGRDDDPAREALWRLRAASRAKPEPTPRWWPDDMFATWLLDGTAIRPRHGHEPAEPVRRLQVHVSLQRETLTAEDGAFFAEDILETLDARRAEWGIGCRLGMSGDRPSAACRPASATIGGGGRLAVLEALPDTLFAPPPALPGRFDAVSSRFIRLIAATPLLFSAGWRPDGFRPDGLLYRGELPGGIPAILRAAFIPRVLHLSGWDIAASRPKDTLRLVPPGAVFFFERTDGRAFDGSDARALWFATLGQRPAEGFGRVVPAVWQEESVAP